MVVVTNQPFIDPNDPENETKTKKDSYAEAYRIISRSLTNETDPRQVRELLQTCLKSSNFHLAQQCVEHLDENLCKTNALQTLSLLKTNTFEPSAPPELDQNHGEQSIAQLYQDLRHNCLLVIDQNAEFIVKQDELLDLAYAELLEIITRDGFCVKNELLIYQLVVEWTNRECQRRNMPLDLRNVAKDLAHAPRFGLLSKKEFSSKYTLGEKGPTRSGIMTEKEWRKVLFYIKEKAKGRDVEELPYRMSQPRLQNESKPKLLSSRSLSQAKESQMLHRKPSQNSSTMNKCDRFLVNFLICWATIFD